MIPFIFLVFLALAGFLFMGIFFKQYVAGMIGAMFMIIFGIDIFLNGILNLNNFLIQSLAACMMGIGAYLLIQGGVDKILEGGE